MMPITVSGMFGWDGVLIHSRLRQLDNLRFFNFLGFDMRDGRGGTCFEPACRLLSLRATENRIVLGTDRFVGFQGDRHPETVFEFYQLAAFMVQDVKRGRSWRSYGDVAAGILEQELLDCAHNEKGN